MAKLTFEDGIYTLNKKKKFKANYVDRNLVDQSLRFAFEMSFGEGFHRNHRSGGTIKRTSSEIFCNAFQGKLAEFILHKILSESGISCSEIDTKVYEKGIWDNGDLLANGKKICIKSAAFFSNLLLLEADDWDKNATYLPKTDNPISYDFFALIRIKPNIKEIFGKISGSFDEIREISDEENFYFDVAGVISKETLNSLIERKFLVKKGETINKTKMDADNFYIQSGDMFSLERFLEELK